MRRRWPALLASGSSPFAALLEWVYLFVAFLGTEHGLGTVRQGDADGHTALHHSFLDCLVPVLADLLEAARLSSEVVAEPRRASSSGPSEI